MTTSNAVSFIIGFMLMYSLHLFSLSCYRKILKDKADAPKQGMSPIEFIDGKPYVIMHENDYINNCRVWYE